MSSTRNALKSSREKFAIRRLRRSELPPDTVKLARFLIGKVVVHDLPTGRLSGRIVETEAYPPGDPAGHHFRGPTPRIRSMYLEPGHAYIFFNYGAHFMLNVVSEPAGIAAAILIRALEPLDGIELMQRHRKTSQLLNLTSIAATTASTFAPLVLSRLAKPAIPRGQSEKPSASAFPARPTSFSGFTSAAILSLAVQNAFFSPSRAAGIRLSRQSNLASRSRLRSRPGFSHCFFPRPVAFVLLLAQSALLRFAGSPSPFKVASQNLVHFLRPDWFREISIHSSGQTLLPIPFHGVRG